jgi:transcriptional regulator with XRE-family HTH domain
MYDPCRYREARVAGGLKQSDVAREARLDPSAIAAYETRRSSPSASAMNRWEVALVRLLTERSSQVENALSTLAVTDEPTA